MQPIIAVFVLWLLWFLGLIAAALWSSRGARRLHPAQEIAYRVVVMAGGLLMFGFHPWPGLDVQYLLWRPLSGLAGWPLVALIFVAFVVAYWGRIRLVAENGIADHFVESGPYKYIRHPIYSGVIVAAFASAMVFGKPSSLIGAALLTIAFVVRILIEEGTLRSETGRYDDYAERVPMLVPLLPAKLWGERTAPPEAPSLLRPTEEPPVSIGLSPPALAAAPVAVAAGTQMSLPLPSPVTMVQAEPAAPPVEAESSVEPVPVSETTADEPVAPDADEAPDATDLDEPQPELSEAMSITKR